MKGPWIKLWRNVLSDPTLSFCMRRYGNDIAVLWIGILTNTENGVLAVEEDILADQCILEEKRYRELRSVLVKRGMIEVDDDDQDGKIVVPNWFEYQESESAERVRRFRERKRACAEPSAQDVLPCNAPVTVGNGDETKMLRVEVEVEVEVEEEGEAEEIKKTERNAQARDEKPPEGIPMIRYEPSGYHETIRKAWEAIGDKVIQVDAVRWTVSTWPKVSAAIRGIHSDDVLAALRNLKTLLDAPEGTYFVGANFDPAFFFERHLDRFLPRNFDPARFTPIKRPAATRRVLPPDPVRKAGAAAIDAFIRGETT